MPGRRAHHVGQDVAHQRRARLLHRDLHRAEGVRHAQRGVADGVMSTAVARSSNGRRWHRLLQRRQCVAAGTVDRRPAVNDGRRASSTRSDTSYHPVETDRQPVDAADNKRIRARRKELFSGVAYRGVCKDGRGAIWD